MKSNGEQAELFGLLWQPYQNRFRLRVNDFIWIGDRLGRVVRVNECAAVVLINRSARVFTTRFDRQVSFQPAPTLIRISVNSETEIVNRNTKRKQRHTKERRNA